MSFGDEVPDEPEPTTDPLAAWPAFAELVRGRLALGAHSYGTATFERPLPEIADELGAELLDQAAYAFIGWARLRELRARAERVEAMLGAAERQP